MHDDLRSADAASRPPAMARRAGWVVPAVAAAVLGLGGLTFAGLSATRGSADDAQRLPVSTVPLTPSSSLPAAPTLPASPTLIAAAPIAAPLRVTPITQLRASTSQTAPAPILVRPVTPALIVDLTSPPAPPPAETTEVERVSGDKLSGNEAFAARAGRSPGSVKTERLASLDRVIPQGTIITGVLETAINSDLPGMVRAVVSRDVTGFDGSRVLIPRGSRLIGQYSSGIAAGQSRAFVIWTRLLRNDGVSVQLGSASTDALGSAGLAGRVNSHFLRRFGAATLLSVVTSGLDYLSSQGRAGDIVIGSSGQANQLASVALQHEIDIPTTIKIAQGTPVRVFVARDLDFANAE